MTSDTSELGRWGEKQAARFLKKQGYRILQRNYVSSLGEIDIVAREGDVLCFVEVKTRTAADFETPLEAVRRSKRRKLALVAKGYLSRHRMLEAPCRFDVVGVTVTEDRKHPEVELVRGAFTVGGR